MTALLVSLIPPLLFSCVNYVDKFMLSDRFEASISTLMLYTTGFSALVAIAVFPFIQNETPLTADAVLIQLVGGLLLAASVHLYLLALTHADVAVVIALSLLTPVFGFLFAYFLLGELVSMVQLFACALIILGALAIVIDLQQGVRFQWVALLAMLGVSAFQAGQEVLFKYAATGAYSYWSVLFWLQLGMCVYGILITITVPGAVKAFVHSVRRHRKGLFGVSLVSECMAAAAYGIRNYAMLFTPVVIVMTLNAFQPVFVLLLGVLFTLVLPTVFKESLHRQTLVVRTIAILIMVGAAIVLPQSV